ncbi:MAG: DMT family transporter [Pseudomonadota bacterium]
MTKPHLIFVIFINLIWGSMFVVATIALFDFPPVFFSALRFGLLTIMLASFLPVARHLIWPLIKVGLVMGVGMYLTLYISLYLAENTASVALVSKLEVPFALILSVLILRENIGIQRITGIAVAFVGAMIIGFDPAALNDIPALLAMTASSGFYAVTMIMIRQMDDVPPLTITAWVSLVCAPVLLLISLVFEENHLQVMQEADLSAWTALAYTVVFGSIISHTGMYYLLQRYPVNNIVPFNLLSPVFAVIGGILFLEDTVSAGLVIGGLMVLAGVGWINIRSGKQENSETPAK